eukprot:s2305_g8.t1
MDVINGAPWAPSPSNYSPQFILPSRTSTPKQAEEKSIKVQEETPAIEDQQPMEEEEKTTSKKQKVTITEETPPHPTTTPTSFAPSMTPARAPAGSPTSRRTLDDSIAEGSTAKQQKTTTEEQAKERPEASPEPPRTKGRINAITIQMKNGQQVTTATCEDPTEAKTEQRLLEPIIKDPQGFDEEKLKKGMIKEMTSLVNQGAFEEITLDQATEEEKRNIIGSKWVHRNKGDEVRSRISGLGCDEVIKDADDVYASTPLFAILRVFFTFEIYAAGSESGRGYFSSFWFKEFPKKRLTPLPSLPAPSYRLTPMAWRAMDVDENGQLFSEGQGPVSPMMALLMGRVQCVMEQRQREDVEELRQEKELKGEKGISKETKDMSDCDARD